MLSPRSGAETVLSGVRAALLLLPAALGGHGNLASFQ